MGIVLPERRRACLSTFLLLLFLIILAAAAAASHSSSSSSSSTRTLRQLYEEHLEQHGKVRKIHITLKPVLLRCP